MNDITTSGYERCVTRRKEFEDWTVAANTGYPLDKNTGTHHAMASYEDVRTEHAWRGFFNGAEQRFVEGRRRVVAAACRDNVTKVVVVSARHYDGAMRNAIAGLRAWNKGEVEQGFIDQRGEFLTRREAWAVAEAAGQIVRRVGGDTIGGGNLFSENLY